VSNSVLSQVDDVQLGASLREAPDLQLNTLKSAIRRLDLSNFRNYRSLRLELDVTPVVLTGSNGAGKTNLMEALSFLAPGRGLRHVPLGDIAFIGNEDVTDSWAVAVRFDSVGGPLMLGTGVENLKGRDQRSRRVISIDGVITRGQSELTKHISMVWLTPEMDRLFLEGSSGRRRFIDRIVFGFDSEHANRLASYEQAVRARQRLLKENSSDTIWLSVLEETIASTGVALSAARKDVVTRLNTALSLRRERTDVQFPGVSIEVVGEVDILLSTNPALAVEDQLRSLMFSTRQSDGASGRTEHGPHRSDLVVINTDKNMPAAKCSTGEQKALLISIILAYAYLLTIDRQATPIILLDEVAAHLDECRRSALAENIKDLGIQAWLTGTDESLFESFGGSAQYFSVADAVVALSGSRKNNLYISKGTG